jgi:hypothetical protein
MGDAGVCFPSAKSTLYTAPVQFIGSKPNKLLTPSSATANQAKQLQPRVEHYE